MVGAAAGCGFCTGWALATYVRAEGSRMPAWAVALGLAAAWAALVWHFGWTARLVAAVPLASALWVVACIDLQTYRIPNPAVAAIALFGLAAQLVPRAASAGPLASVLAGLGAGACFTVLALATRGGFGWGDAKLAAAMAWVLGPRGALTAMLATGLAGGLGAAVLLASRRRSRRDALPFAPFFLIGGTLALLSAPR